MPSYRFYCLDGTGRITGAAETIEAATDEDAIAAARDRASNGRCEVWQGRRLVVTIPAPRSSS